MFYKTNYFLIFPLQWFLIVLWIPDSIIDFNNPIFVFFQFSHFHTTRLKNWCDRNCVCGRIFFVYFIDVKFGKKLSPNKCNKLPNILWYMAPCTTKYCFTSWNIERLFLASDPLCEKWIFSWPRLVYEKCSSALNLFSPPSGSSLTISQWKLQKQMRLLIILVTLECPHSHRSDSIRKLLMPTRNLCEKKIMRYRYEWPLPMWLAVFIVLDQDHKRK